MNFEKKMKCINFIVGFLYLIIQFCIFFIGIRTGYSIGKYEICRNLETLNYVLRPELCEGKK